jgi:type 1 fimbriae regulatory protein FimB/type 1 fimbriae regulatory protein FimE
MAANTNLGLVAPTAEKQTVAASIARRRPNAALRSREDLTLDEVERLIAAAKQCRWGHRDATMLLVAYRHGLRASELTDLHCDRLLDSQPSRPARQEGQLCYPPHPRRRAARPTPPAARAGPQITLRFHQRARRPVHHCRLRTHCRGCPRRANLQIKAHPHMLRHACGFKLANDGHDTRALQAYLGQR